ncbi:serine/threonine protein kinase [Limnoglobus roseus]|uniref:non-specific serine/threonine protein kinase n=1 Tax=Limnoglobus roseus TaxID=2598579 RepID=A0A5C1A6E4_9BACT|nr:serine/threonine-protein kinase [Limnoglobus roseus]QEL14290.1 serine/threonine protein kinase [Limnoglobus roseus]
MIGRMFLGRYEAQKLLGEGGMGKVYLARQTDLNRTVVVKIMHDHVASDPKFRERFQRETLVMARFQHPNAVTLYDASMTDEYGSCIVMEYVKGVNLESLLQKNSRLSFGRVSRVVSQLCDVLQAAHEQGIIHRDLKPANIMISEPDTPKERVKVMDFGLAKLIDDAALKQVTDTAVDFAVGTPGYIAPEQVRGEMMDHRGDLYSVGVMLFELLTGRLPFQGATSMDVLLAHATEDPPKFSELGLGRIAPRAVEDVIRWCLAKDPAARPQNARDLAEAFAKAVSGGSPADSGLPQLSRMPVPEPESEPIALVATGSPRVMVALQADVRDLTPAPGVMLAPATIPLSNTPAAAPKQKKTPTPTAAPVPTAGTLPFQLDAWMPESIAVMKLRGFVHDTGGAVLDCQPGLIRVRLEKIGVKAAGGKLAWLGLGRKTDGPVEMVLHMQRVNPQKEPNRLSIHVLFRPLQATLLGDDAWRQCCSELFVKLRAYLMG